MAAKITCWVAKSECTEYERPHCGRRNPAAAWALITDSTTSSHRGSRLLAHIGPSVNMPAPL